MRNPPDGARLAAEILAGIRGNWTTQMLFVAAELRIADHLADQPLDIGPLADLCGARPASLYRLMRGLASLGVFEEVSPRRFISNDKGALLRSDHPASLRHAALLQGGERYCAWGDLLECVRTGDSAFGKRYGKPVFAWNLDHPERAAVFDAAMADYSRMETTALLEAYEFGPFSHLIDVGGGNGLSLQLVLEHHPQLQGTLFDLPQVIDTVVTPAHLVARWTSAAGNFFDAIPRGADSCLLKNVLHDWGDEECLTLLGRVREAGAGRGMRLLVYEQLIPDGNAPYPGKLLDLNMLVMHERGQERTFAEYEDLLGRAGFKIHRVVPTRCALSLIEASAGSAC